MTEVNSFWTPWDQPLNSEKNYFFLVPELRVFEDLVAQATAATAQPVDLRPPNSLPQFHTHVSLSICLVPSTDLLFALFLMNVTMRTMQEQMDRMDLRSRALRGSAVTLAGGLASPTPSIY